MSSRAKERRLPGEVMRDVVTMTVGREHARAPAGVATDADTADERALAALERSDRREALRILMQAYGDRVRNHCVRMLRDAELADDIRQLVFQQAYEGLNLYRQESSFASWLIGIAQHRCLDALKAKQRHRQHFAAGKPAV